MTWILNITIIIMEKFCDAINYFKIANTVDVDNVDKKWTFTGNYRDVDVEKIHRFYQVVLLPRTRQRPTAAATR